MEPSFAVLSDEPGAWPAILSSVGFQQRPAAKARVIVVRPDAPATTDWPARVANGAFLVLEGESSTAASFGFQRSSDNVRAASVEDVHRPQLAVVWEKPLEMLRFEAPREARIFARERWTGAPLMAGFRRGGGAVLWVALSPGERGHERFPFLLHALADLGLEAPVRSNRLWAFFDSSYRLRADLDYLAARWARAGIAGLHVAAWQYYVPDPGRDAWLRRLVATCHREGILVYAWLELPHVSEAFWDAHPEWREKTAVLQDAQLDWRRLMNLANPDCAKAALKGITDLLDRFDWDGVNLAELYFESLEGLDNPARFTPFNDDVRRMFRQAHGFDPVEIFRTRSDATSRRAFLDFRAGLAARIQQQWLEQLEQMRGRRPYLDIAVTHVDDRFDQRMRDAVGADAAAVLPLLDRHRFTFLVEDPATIWHLGPQRYGEIARKYSELTPRRESLGIDINVVERYQDVYPTRQQAGTELFQLVRAAASAFPRVALYFENSILPADWTLLPAAAAGPVRLDVLDGRVAFRSKQAAGVPWREAALVDGRPWPVLGDGVAWLPAGSHVLEAGPTGEQPHLRRLNAELISAHYAETGGIEFAYRSASRAIAVLDRPPVRVGIDGAGGAPVLAGPSTLLLPNGQHVIAVEFPNVR